MNRGIPFFIILFLCATFVAAQPLSTVTQPIELDHEPPFYPEGKPLRGLVITLDPGHGGSAHQPGYSGSARGINSGVVEGDLNMRVSAQVRHHLIKAGAEVHMTRWDDRKVVGGNSGRDAELGERVALAERTKSHMFLSLHHNAAPRKTADGVVVLIWPTAEDGTTQTLEIAFADALREEVEKKVHFTEEFGHYIHKHPLVVNSEMPSAVIEFGFLSNAEFDEWVSQKGIHRPEAIGIYNGVKKFWEENKEALEAKRQELFPGAPKARGGNKNISDARPPLEKLVETLWLSEDPPADAFAAKKLLNLYKNTVLSDKTFFYLNTEVQSGSGEWTVTGSTNHPILLEAATEVLFYAGCPPTRNYIDELPSDKLGEKKFGVVQIPMALTWAKPEENSGVQTQLMLGEHLFLLDVTEDKSYYLAHAADGYVGWVREEAVLPMTQEEFMPWITMPRATVVRDYYINDFLLPVGAQLLVLDSDSNGLMVRLPTGVKRADDQTDFEIPLSHVQWHQHWKRARAAAMTATELLTTPYVFGGRSSQGLDCSGLTGISYQSAGIRLPRDAKQQVLVGQMVATPWFLDALRAGDLLFFIDETGRVTHTGVSLGGKKFIHASPPEVHVTSLDPNDPEYSKKWAEKFAFARRIVD